MSTHVIGFAPPDEEWKKMKKIYDACEEGGMEPPEEVLKFFNWEEPDNAGVEIELKEHEFNDESRQGIEIKIDELPPQVKLIRFYNSY